MWPASAYSLVVLTWCMCVVYVCGVCVCGMCASSRRCVVEEQSGWEATSVAALLPKRKEVSHHHCEAGAPGVRPGGSAGSGVELRQHVVASS